MQIPEVPCGNDEPLLLTNDFNLIFLFVAAVHNLGELTNDAASFVGLQTKNEGLAGEKTGIRMTITRTWPAHISFERCFGSASSATVWQNV
jgi:hypothetical protein